MIYLTPVKHNGRQELRYSPPLHFSVPHTQYCIFWKFLGQKIFFGHFAIYCTELEFWILTQKNEKKYFFNVSLIRYCNFFWKFWVKYFFLSHFELYCTELEFWILTPKNDKNFGSNLNMPRGPYTIQFFLIAAEKPRQAS